MAQLAQKYGAQMIFSSDSHSHSQMVTYEFAMKVIRGAGISDEVAEEMFAAAYRFVEGL